MRFLVLLLSASIALDAAAASSERNDEILIQSIASGAQKVATEADGSTRAEYSYNDRGRGDKVAATWKIDAAGIPIEYTGSGNDYMKAPVDEHYTFSNGKAIWKC